MAPTKPVLTAQEAMNSMKQMRDMTKILTGSTKDLEKIFNRVNEKTANIPMEDDGEDSDFSTSMIRELSNKSIDRELNDMIVRRQKEKELKKSRRQTSDSISRSDMSMLMFFFVKKCDGELKATEVLKKHKNTDKYRKKILQLSCCKSIENPVKMVHSKLKVIISRADNFLNERCKLDVTAEELFRIYYNILTKYDSGSSTWIFRSQDIMREARAFLSESRKDWRAPAHFTKLCSKNGL